MNRHVPTSALILAPVLALTLVGCGSGDDDPVLTAPTPTTTATSAPAADGARVVTARDYRFDGLEGITPTAGTTLQFTMRNSGERPHDLVVRAPDGSDVGGVDTIDAGEQGTGSAALKAAGVYRYLCTIGSHEQLGMKGTFTVS